MKKTILGATATLFLLHPLGAFAECAIPSGTYKYLYSDGFETYYFNDKTTVRVDAAGTQILEQGDFDVALEGKRYQRAGDRFTFTNENGRYASIGDGPISFYPSNPGTVQTAAVLPAGTSFTDFFGTYTKQVNGGISFKPRLVYPPLVISDDKCAAAAAPTSVTPTTTVITTPTTTIVSTPDTFVSTAGIGTVPSGTVVAYDYDKVIVEMGAKKQGDALVVDLDSDILFNYDKSDITDKARENLKKLAYLIHHDRKGLVVVRGHTDSNGSEDYNQALSLRRAQSVASWLEANEGITRDNFLVQGFGESYPKVPNAYSNGQDNPEGRAKNRRVEVLIQTVAGAKVPAPAASAGTVAVTPAGIVVQGNGGTSAAAEARANAAEARANAAEARANAAAARANAAAARSNAQGSGNVLIGPGGIVVQGTGNSGYDDGDDDEDATGSGTVSIGPNGIVVHGEGY